MRIPDSAPGPGHASPRKAASPSAPPDADRYVETFQAADPEPGLDPAFSRPKPLPSGASESSPKAGEAGTAKAEPKPLHGMLALCYPTGRYTVLRSSGETRPEIPPGGQPDIPQAAAPNGRVVMQVNGIGEEFGYQLETIGRFLQATTPVEHGANVGQPVVAVHQGVDRNSVADVARITADLGGLRLLEKGALPLAWIQKAVYRFDPTVRTLHDELKQSLAVGRDVTLVAMSGGGSESALALNLLAREEGGRYRDLIRDHVRVLGLAPAASRRDFEAAGVQSPNLYATGSQRDPVYQFGRHSAGVPMVPGFVPGIAALASTFLRYGSTPTHSQDYIFAASAAQQGGHPIQGFLDGGPGGDYTLP